MDMSEQVKLFISYSQALADLLRREENAPSDLELHALKSHLHVLEDRITKIQSFRRSGQAA
jgi:hypothetical protein